jgi:peptidoglycan-associated lipoprotein
MNRIVVRSMVAALGVILLSSQGCGMKWVKAGGDTEAGDTSTQLPSMSRGGSSGELRGFSQNPSEERLTQNSFATSRTPSDLTSRRRAELTKEEKAAEKAAIDAGLQDVFYGYDQWAVPDGGMEALNHDAAYLKDHPEAVLRIEGHCDERGTSDYNIVLGDKRAKAARSYLVEAGVSPKQVAIVSFGKERPFCFEHDESCYQQNRRGHLLLNTKK